MRKPKRADPHASSLFERALDNLPDGVLLVREGKTIVYANSAFEKIWNVPPGIVGTGDDSALLPWVANQVADTAAFVGEVKRLYGSLENSEDMVPLKDGRMISRRSVPFQEDSTLHTRIWIFTDVTEARHAGIDMMTGLPNRRAYSRDFPAAVLAEDDGLVRTVSIMDIDNFKSYNDRYGHAAGDEVLRQIGALLRQRFTRSDDLVFRIGGEEFLLSSRFRESASVSSFFEEIRKGVQLAGIEHTGNSPYNCVTASFGVAIFTGPREPDAVFRHADGFLYDAKASGRNKVCLGPLP
jgi:diguanylate cyclase (GGDEF)-like protein